MKRKVAFFSVVPSPYQRDLFRALATRPEINLQVFYLEKASPDSPWPQKALESYESILPGSWFSIGKARVHWNWPLPNLDSFDLIVLNILVPSLTAQWLMRLPLRNRRWIFWAEKLGSGTGIKRSLSAPLNRARAIVGIGSWAEKDYRFRFPRPRHYCIPYHCNLAGFHATSPPSRTDESVVFLFCGQMIARKGLDLLLDAFSNLPSNARLLLVGREAELPHLLPNLPANVRDRIEYAGFQAPDDLPHFFAEADVFVLPSRYDGWGVVVNQAIAAALPVICSDQVGAGYDLVESNRNGLVFPAGDAIALRHAMEHFIAHPEAIREWGAHSREKSFAFTPECGAEKWVKVIEETLAP